VKKSANERFFGELFIEMRGKLLRYAEAKIPDKGNAEDIVEETFKTAWLKIDDLKASENPHGWLINALKIHILKHYNVHTKEHINMRETLDTDIPACTVFDNEISFERTLTADEMQIAKLKEAGYTHDEISSMMNVPPGTVHSKVSRIKDKLRKFMGSEKI
jgi:RNA polymerase sigma-70 factor (ECF subfamily)